MISLVKPLERRAAISAQEPSNPPGAPLPPLQKVVLAGVEIDNVSFDQALERIDQLVRGPGPSLVVTPNVDHICQLQQNPRYQEIYARADLVLADGMPLIWASRFLGTPLGERVTGSDLFPRICGLAARRGYRVYLLGGLGGVAEKAKAVLEERYPGLEITGTYSPPFGFEHDPEEMAGIVERIAKASPQILFVGLGAPKQEFFIAETMDTLRIPVSMGVGASFDFVAGTMKRAPGFMRRWGLEWLFRLLQEPGRLFHRYLIRDMGFFRLILKQRLGSGPRAGQRSS